MARRARKRDTAALRKRRPRRDRSAARAGGARIVPLTAARRRMAAARRRSRLILAPDPEAPAAPATGARRIDFHLATCVSAARAGARVLLEYWKKRGTYPIQEKSRNDFVTVVDREAEAAILRLVRERFPDHSIMAEESAPREGAAGYRWYIDPLDGTTNFIHGYPLFCVSIGVADAQGMRAGAVYDPLRDEMFTAARGAGAHLNGTAIAATPLDDLSKALLVTGFPFRSLDRIDEYLASFRSFILNSAGIRRDGSAALNLAYVAAGRLDGFWEMSLSPWDVAAGSLIVREAGGLVSDFQGRDAFMTSGNIVAAARGVHAGMLRILRETAPGSR